MQAAFEKKAATVRGRAGAMSTGSAHRPVNWKHFMAVMAGTGAILALVIAAGYFYEQHRTATPSAPLRAVPKPTPVPDPRRADDRAR
jgi:hypothetical protein